jgi:hypothetical protein
MGIKIFGEIKIKTIPGIGGKGNKRRMMESVNSSMIYFIYCKNFCKCHNVPPSSKVILKKEKIAKKRQHRPNNSLDLYS